MAFVPDEVLEVFKFETGFHKKFKPAMDAYLAKKGKPSIEAKKAIRNTPRGEEKPAGGLLMSKLAKGLI
jgi:hypothetical protein